MWCQMCGATWYGLVRLGTAWYGLVRLGTGISPKIWGIPRGLMTSQKLRIGSKVKVPPGWGQICKWGPPSWNSAPSLASDWLIQVTWPHIWPHIWPTGSGSRTGNGSWLLKKDRKRKVTRAPQSTLLTPIQAEWYYRHHLSRQIDITGITNPGRMILQPSPIQAEWYYRHHHSRQNYH